MSWSLAELRDLDVDEYDALLDWAKAKSDQSAGEDGAIDVDTLVDATRKAAKAKDDA